MRILSSNHLHVSTVFWEDSRDRTTMSVVCVLEKYWGAGLVLSGTEHSAVAGEEKDSPEGQWLKVRNEAIQAPFKPKADVVLLGTAYAPGGKAVKGMEVSLRVGRVQKKLRVMGDRRWRFGSFSMLPTPSDPEPFTTMPLTYDRAFGGIDAASAAWYPENPTGRGFIGAKTKEAIHDRLLPNIEDAAAPVTSWDSRPKLPAGFDFCGRGWLPRRKHAGTYDEKHEKERAPKLPLDFSYALFNGAHPDLQVEGYLKGDEEVELRGVTPEGVVRFRLPGIRPKITVARWAVDPMRWIEEKMAAGQSVTLDQAPVTEEQATPVLDTLVLLPDEGIFYEVFRAVVPLKALDSLEIARIRVEE